MIPARSAIGTGGRPAARRGLVAGLLLIVLAGFSIRFDRQGRITGGLMWALAPLQGWVTRGGQSVRTFGQDYLALVDVRQDNRELEDRVRTLQADASRAADLTRENARLRRLLELGDARKDLRLRAARVVARSTSEVFRVLHLVLDVGEGPVEQGMVVLAPAGVVGQIRAIKGSRAEVLLITDPRSAIDVVLEQSRAPAVAVGSGEPDRYAAHLRYLGQAIQPVLKERALTTGDDGHHPRGLVVGEVIEVSEPESGPFKRTTIRPLVDFGTLEEVFIVLGPSGLTPDGARFETEAKKP